MVGNIVWVSALAVVAVSATSVPVVTVLIYNYANVPGAVLADAEGLAAKTYRSAGIDLRWRQCATSEDRGVRFQLCEEARQNQPLSVNIITEVMASKIPKVRDTEHALGMALVASAYVRYERVQETADIWAIPTYILLGRTVAHEIGHLLLGENSHSATGLMQPSITAQYLGRGYAAFRFEPKQAARLKQALQARAK